MSIQGTLNQLIRTAGSLSTIPSEEDKEPKDTKPKETKENVAEKNAVDRVTTRVETLQNQRTAIEERFDAVKLADAARQMRADNIIPSNKQLKSILYNINRQGGQ